MFRVFNMDGSVYDQGEDWNLLDIPGFVRPATPAQKAKYGGDVTFMVFGSGNEEVGYVTSEPGDFSPGLKMPDDVTGAAASPAPNVQFVGDSATFDALPEIRRLAGLRAKSYANQGDLVEFAFQVLAAVYEKSKAKE